MATKSDIQQIRDALGIGNDVSDAALETLMSSPKGKAELKKIEAQPTGNRGILGDIAAAASGVESGAKDVGNVLNKTVGPGNTPSWIAENIGAVGVPELIRKLVDSATGGGSTTEAATPKTAKAKPLPDPAKAAGSIPESPYQELAQALASEYLNQVNQLMPLTSGSALFGPGGLTNQVVSGAAAMIPGGGGWLQQQAAAEQKAAAPLQAAMNQVGEAQAQGALGYAGAIGNTGTANTQYLEAAPWQQILSELASETAYKAASTQGAAAFGLTPQNTPAFLSQILQSHGLSGTAGSAGLQAPGTAAKGGAPSKSTVPTTQSQTG